MVIRSDGHNIKTLGVKWTPNPDQIGLAVKLDKEKLKTKRQILSEVSRIFGLSGWLLLTTIQHKLFVQLLWMDNLSCDQFLLDANLQQYRRFRIQLENLEIIYLKRNISMPVSESDYQLHIFCDTSLTASSAVIFFRQKFVSSTNRVAIIQEFIVATDVEICSYGTKICRLCFMRDGSR